MDLAFPFYLTFTDILKLTSFRTEGLFLTGPVVQRVDSVIRWIGFYPVDEICWKNSIKPHESHTERK